MGKFAKLIELEDGEQVLVVINFDNIDKHQLSLKTEVEGVLFSVDIEFDDEDDVIEALECYSVENAIAFRNEMKNMFS